MAETLKIKNQKPKRVLEIIFVIFASIFSVASIAISSCIIFHNNYYEFFWVNGQSMYPTLNKDAKYGESAGDNKKDTLIGSRDLGPTIGNYDVDYGYMDTHPSVINSIGRFDIIVCKQLDSEKDVIKRVLALPGETFYFVASGAGQKDNGDLYVKKPGEEEFSLVEQSFIIFPDKEDSSKLDDSLLRAGDYADSRGNPKYHAVGEGYTLADNEYFVVGDNRLPNCSSDSRRYQTGIYRENIKGKAIGLEGKCEVGRGEKGYTSINVKHFFPTRF